MKENPCILHTHLVSSIGVSGHVKSFFTCLSVSWWTAPMQLFGSLALRHGCTGNSIYNLQKQTGAKRFQNTICTGLVTLLPDIALQSFLTSYWDYQDSRESKEKAVYFRLCRPILLLVRVKEELLPWSDRSVVFPGQGKIRNFPFLFNEKEVCAGREWGGTGFSAVFYGKSLE